MKGHGLVVVNNYRLSHKNSKELLGDFDSTPPKYVITGAAGITGIFGITVQLSNGRGCSDLSI